MCSTISTRNPPRTTSTKTTVRLFFKHSKWRRSSDTNRFPTCDHRGVVRDALEGVVYTVLGARNLQLLRHEILRYWGGRLQIIIAKPTTCTAGCELVLHNGNFFGATASNSEGSCMDLGKCVIVFCMMYRFYVLLWLVGDRYSL